MLPRERIIMPHQIDRILNAVGRAPWALDPRKIDQIEVSSRAAIRCFCRHNEFVLPLLDSRMARGVPGFG